MKSKWECYWNLIIVLMRTRANVRSNSDLDLCDRQVTPMEPIAVHF